MKTNIILICKRVLYYSDIDESLFFEWIKRIPSITKIQDVHDELHLYLENNDLSHEDLWELSSMFKRYKVDRKQLAVFLNKNNEHWLKERVYPKKK